MIMKIIFLFFIMINSLYSFHITLSLYDKNPTINYLNYLNNIKKIPIYSKTNLIKKTTYDDVFLNICDNNICEFIIDDDVKKLIVKYHNGMCKIYYNSDNSINKLINIYLMNTDSHINFSSLNENEEKYYYEK